MPFTLVADDPDRDGLQASRGVLGRDTEVRGPDEGPLDAPGLVVGRSGADVFETVQPDAGAWLALELGGIGGHTLPVAGCLVGLAADGPCYACVRQRVAAAEATVEADRDIPADPAVVRYGLAVAGWWLAATDGVAGAAGRVRVLGRGERRQALPVPGCRCDDRPRQRIDLTDTDAPERAAIERAERAVDDWFGPVLEVGEQSSWPVPYYIARLASTTGFSDAQAARFAAGVDHGWDDAFMRSLGEALERYCAGVYRTDALPSDHDGDAVSLSAIPTAHADATPTGRWWPGWDLRRDAPCALPLEAVVFPPPDGADVDAITTGLGLGNSTVEAILAGALEVIERDACMLAWYSTFEPVALAVDTPGYRTMERRLFAEGLGATALLVTQDIDVPVVTAVVHRRDAEGASLLEAPHVEADDWPAFAVGSAAAYDPAGAAERALAEAIQNWTELDGMGPERAAEEQGTVAEFAGFPRRARALLAYDHTLAAEAVGPAETPTGTDALEAVLGDLAAADLDAYVARLTTRDVADLGFEAVRVVVPGAQPLVQSREHVTDRLRSVPRDLGFQPRLDRGEHPYP